MKMNYLIILLLVFCSTGCEKLADHTNFIRIHNYTNDTVQAYAGYDYPDTMLCVEKPRLVMIYPNTQDGGLESKTDWKDKLQSDTLIIFLLSKDTVDTYSWEEIKNDYKILLRYDLSINDLENQNWTIIYP